jgi:hypothetical protein
MQAGSHQMWNRICRGRGSEIDALASTSSQITCLLAVVAGHW